MQSEQRALSELEIVAFADVVSPEMTPIVLPPIFKAKDKDEVIFPPFHIKGEYVYFTYMADADELKRQLASERATPLESPIPARPFHELWLDLDQKIRYEPWDEVAQLHKDLARKFAKRAKESFLKNDIAAAKSECAIAINAYSQMLEPFVILAAIASQAGQSDYADVYASAVADYCDSDSFNLLVNSLVEVTKKPRRLFSKESAEQLMRQTVYSSVGRSENLMLYESLFNRDFTLISGMGNLVDLLNIRRNKAS